VLDTSLTERKRAQNKPIRQATKDYRNNKNDSENNKTTDKKKKTNKVSTEEKQEPSPLKREQGTRTTVGVRKELIPEVFGSSSHDDVSEMKDSAYIQEDDLKNAISNVRKKEPTNAEVRVYPKNRVSTYLQSVNPITTIKERIVESREKSFEKRGSIGDNPFMSSMASWQSGMISWIEIYKDFSENVAKMTREYWMMSFWIPRRSEYKTSDEVKAG
jgi:hypothetical protein